MDLSLPSLLEFFTERGGKEGDITINSSKLASPPPELHREEGASSPPGARYQILARILIGLIWVTGPCFGPVTVSRSWDTRIGLAGALAISKDRR